MVNKNPVWSMEDYGNLSVAEQLWKLKNAGTAGAPTRNPDGTSLSLDRLFPGQNPGVSTVTNATGRAPTAGVRATAQDILKDPKAFAAKGNIDEDGNLTQETSILDRPKKIISSLFDTEDEADLKIGPVDLSAVESTWDGFLKGFNWIYNRINQVTVAGMSGLPGGTRTLTWDEANDVSFGQQLVSNMGVSAGKLNRGEGNVADFLAAGPIGLLAGKYSSDSEIQQEGFDISDEEDRKVFEQGDEKWMSGIADFGFAFADPFFLVGVPAKLARLRFIDRPLYSQESINKLVKIEPDGSITGEVMDINSPVGALIEKVFTEKTPWREILQRPEIKDSSHAEAIAIGLSEGTSKREMALIIGAAASDMDSIRLLQQESASAFTLLQAKERQLLQVRAIVEPEKLAKETHTAQVIAEDSLKAFEEAKIQAGKQEISSIELERVGDISRQNVLKYEILSKGIATDPLGYGGIPTSSTIKQFQEEIIQLTERNKYFERAINSQGSLQNTNRGFASNTALGRTVSRRRDRIAKGRYDTMSQRGSWSKEEFFSKDGLKRTLQVMKYTPGLENPAYYLATKGTGAVDSSRETGAILDTIEMFSGAPKSVVVRKADGTETTQMFGGRQVKEEILAEYTKAIISSDNVGFAADAFETAIQRQLSGYYGLADDVMEHVIDRSKGARQKLADEITNPERRWFPVEGTPETIAVLARAPFLESQLMEGMYVLPYDQIERVLMGLNSGKIKNTFTETMTKQRQTQMVDKTMYSSKGYLLARTEAINDVFQSVWRPLVLMRLGYPMRNVTEGLFRSVVFNQSLSPIVLAGKAGINGASNIRRAARAEKKSQKYAQDIKRAQGSADPYNGIVQQRRALMDEQAELVKVVIPVANPSKGYTVKLKGAGKGRFADKDDNFSVVWNDDPNNFGWKISERTDDGEFIEINKIPYATIDEAKAVIERNVADAVSGTKNYDPSVFPSLARINKQYGSAAIDPANTKAAVSKAEKAKATRMQKIDDELEDLQVQLESLGTRELPAGLKGSKFGKWRDAQIKAINDSIDQSIEFEARFIDDAGGWVKLNGKQQEELVQLRNVRRSEESSLAALITDDYYALNEFTSNASRKKIVDVGKDIALDNGVILSTAFGNPRFRGLAENLLSADNTIKATMSVRANLSQSLWLQKRAEMFVDVMPDMGPAYWDGMETMLRQYSQSKIGQMLAGGVDQDEIVNWLLRSDEGRKWRDTLDSSTRSLDGNAAILIGESQVNAASYVDKIFQSLNQITLGDPSVLTIITKRAPTAVELKRLMSKYDNLNPVVGNMEELVGYPSLMESWRKATSWIFERIGTMPEDAFVRGPFYAMQYKKNVDNGLNILLEQYKDSGKIPIERINLLEVNSHRRAVKDTKEFLYTIDRRTTLGKNTEWLSPFISATQNSVTAIGKLTRREPALPGLMAALWNAPTRVGWEDENGNLNIPLPKALIPDGIEEFFGLTGIDNMSISKAGLNVIFPESGFAFVPRPTPLIQVAASQLMKKGLLIDITAPSLMVSVLGDSEANNLWNGFKDYMFGEGQGVSVEPLSWDKLAPPSIQRLVQLGRKEQSTQYAYQYALQARTQDLLWRAGERDEYPKSEEIMKRTNGQFILRFLGNMLAFTPPDYKYPIQPLIDLQRKYDRVYGLEGPQRFSEQFGNEVLILSGTDTTKNIGGALSNTKAVGNIKKYESLIRGIAPRIGDDLSLLGIIVNTDAAEAEYDPSSYRWMSSTNIPGTSRNWRELLSGPESMRESQRTAGWVEFTKFMGSLDAMLTEAGFSSYRVKGASELNQARRDFIENMKENPNYEGWRIDYEDIGGKRSENALLIFQSALQDPEFMKDKADNRTWQAAAMYLEGRKEVMVAVAATGKTINDPDNVSLAEEWDAFRLKLNNYDNGWSALSNRFLNADDNPQGGKSEASFFEGNL